MALLLKQQGHTTRQRVLASWKACVAVRTRLARRRDARSRMVAQRMWSAWVESAAARRRVARAEGHVAARRQRAALRGWAALVGDDESARGARCSRLLPSLAVSALAIA
eukprot:1522723-Rhodomonas_salina.2